MSNDLAVLKAEEVGKPLSARQSQRSAWSRTLLTAAVRPTAYLVKPSKRGHPYIETVHRYDRKL